MMVILPQSISSLGLRPDNAADVSFIELLHVLACKKNSLVPVDLNIVHLRRVNEAVIHGSAVRALAQVLSIFHELDNMEFLL